MKKTFAIIAAICLALTCALVLSGCPSQFAGHDTGETGTFTITIGRGIARAASPGDFIPWDSRFTIGQIRHVIRVYPSTGPSQSQTVAPGGSGASFTVTPGQTRIVVEGWEDALMGIEMLVSFGETTQTIVAGANTVIVEMDEHEPVQSVEIDQTGPVNLAVGGTQQLTATVEPSDASVTRVRWESDDTDIATVSPTGLVTGVGPGTASISAHSVSDPEALHGWIQVEVLPPPPVIAMQWVPAGVFMLGQELGTAGDGNTYALTEVTLTAGFWIGRYSVTQEQFYAVMGFNSSYFTTAQGRPPAPGETDARRPVENINWFEAIVFSNRLSIMHGLTLAYVIPGIAESNNPAWWMALQPGDIPATANATWNAVEIVAGSNGYRLPTEAQWEFAAKGGPSQSPYTFSGSNTVTAVAWHTANSGGMTREVGGLAGNALGVHDMSGNVFEWVWDWYHVYPGGTKTDWAGASSGTSNRVMRGGAWSSGVGGVRSVHRGTGAPAGRGTSRGFRVARP